MGLPGVIIAGVITAIGSYLTKKAAEKTKEKVDDWSSKRKTNNSTFDKK